MKKCCLSLLLVVGYLLLATAPAYAACTPGNPNAAPPIIDSCVVSGGVCTALGCVPINKTAFVGWVLGRAMVLGGGIAFLLMIGGAIQLVTSSGHPEGIKKGGEAITSALMGLLFIILSLFLLHLIGFDLLKIPGF